MKIMSMMTTTIMSMKIMSMMTTTIMSMKIMIMVMSTIPTTSAPISEVFCRPVMHPMTV